MSTFADPQINEMHQSSFQPNIKMLTWIRAASRLLRWQSNARSMHHSFWTKNQFNLWKLEKVCCILEIRKQWVSRDRLLKFFKLYIFIHFQLSVLEENRQCARRITERTVTARKKMYNSRHRSKHIFQNLWFNRPQTNQVYSGKRSPKPSLSTQQNINKKKARICPIRRTSLSQIL